MKKFLFFLIFLILIANLFAFHPKPMKKINPAGSYYLCKADSSHGFDVIKYIITLSIDTDNSYIQGNVQAIVQAQQDMNFIEYELEALEVTNVLVNNQQSNYTYQNGIIHIDLGNIAEGEQFTTKVYYQGNPQLSDDGYGLGMFFGNNYVMTLVDPSGCRWWWPAYDHPWDKAIVDLHITIRDDWLVASNGIRESIEDNQDGTKTHNWIGQYPMATYLVVITAANYQELNQEYNNIPIQNFVSPSQYQQATETLSNLPFMMQVYSSEYGDYPFEKYGNAVSPISTYAAMEHQTMTTLGNFIITGNHNYETTIAHELSHHWFGDCLTPLTWKDVWLSESFATYSELIYTHHWQGWQAATNYADVSFHNYYLNWAGSYGPHTIYDPDYYDYFAPPSYEKGASVLHMLRLKLGGEMFFDILRTYFQTFKYGNVVTQDFIDICQEVSGEDLTQFFNQWIYNPGTPTTDYTYFVDTSSTPPRIMICAETTSNTSNQFYLEIPAQINYSAGSDSVLFNASPIEPQTNIFNLSYPDISSIEIDPNHWILSRGFTYKTVLIDNALAGNGQVILQWNDFWDDLDIDGYNIYRSTQENGSYTLINEAPITGNEFIDENVVNYTTYYYKICAVKDNTFLSEFSQPVSATPIDFPMDQGILVIDETDDGNGTILHPTDADVDDFYDTVINRPHTNYDYNAEGSPTLEYLANYSLVIWHNDDISLSDFVNNKNLILSYINGGGNLLVSAWKTYQNLPSDFFDFFFTDIDFFQINQMVLSQASSNIYTNLDVDNSKIPASFNGELPFITMFINTDSSIFYISSLDGNDYEGESCGIKMVDSSNVLAFLGFPLYYFNQNEVAQFMEEFITEVEQNHSDNDVVQISDKVKIYPNPFGIFAKEKNYINIRFNLNAEKLSHIKIFNLKGELIKSIDFNGKKGENIVKWDGSDKNDKTVKSGLYLIRIEDKQPEKIVIVR